MQDDNKPIDSPIIAIKLNPDLSLKVYRKKDESEWNKFLDTRSSGKRKLAKTGTINPEVKLLTNKKYIESIGYHDYDASDWARYIMKLLGAKKGLDGLDIMKSRFNPLYPGWWALIPTPGTHTLTEKLLKEVNEAQETLE